MYSTAAAQLTCGCHMQVFDVITFDMIAMLRLPFVPSCAAFIYKVSASLHHATLLPCTLLALQLCGTVQQVLPCSPGQFDSLQHIACLSTLELSLL